MAETLTVTQLNNRVKSILAESSHVKDIWVMGEISNLTRAASGHYYFTLKDEICELKCIMFRTHRSRIDFEPEENMKVKVFGRADIYVQRGTYQFIIETMERSGVGELYIQFEKLKRELEAEGLFDDSRKKKLPPFPRTVGVVTSETGAVIHDIITTSAKLFPADILLAPAMVQGIGAGESIVRGIELLNRIGVDVMIVGRGGGSIEDLWAFNLEMVARAIAASEVPVISAVGHESDVTIADMVADARAPTPTGAAEMALPDPVSLMNILRGHEHRASKALTHKVAMMKSRLETLTIKSDSRRKLEDIGMLQITMDNLMSRADSALKSKVQFMRSRYNVADSKISPRAAKTEIKSLGESLNSYSERLKLAIKRIIKDSNSKAEALGKRADALNPLGVLTRGYSYVTDSQGNTLTSAKALSEGSVIDVRFRDGSAEAEVKKVKNNG